MGSLQSAYFVLVVASGIHNTCCKYTLPLTPTHSHSLPLHVEFSATLPQLANPWRHTYTLNTAPSLYWMYVQYSTWVVGGGVCNPQVRRCPLAG